jgi:proteasome component ECM29
MQSLEDSRINYIEQHAASAGLSEDKLSSARVSASRRSPMADTLDLCLRYLDAAMLEAVVPLLSHKVGVSADGRGTPTPTRVVPTQTGSRARVSGAP